MKGTSFKETNLLLGAGDNINTEQLPICVADHPDDLGKPSLVSKWKLSEEELEMIKKEGCIWLAVSGGSHPPVRLMAFNPFEYLNFTPRKPD
jgi:hypothetical protein